MNPKILVTGASGIAGRETVKQLLAAGYSVRGADVGAFPEKFGNPNFEFLRCDTRSPQDAERAVAGCDAIVHLAAWHCAHNPPVSDPTIFGVNVDGTFYVFEACRAHKIKTIVYASSMAYGHGSVYGVTKVIGEDLCRSYHEIMRIPVAMLRYHDFVPKPYLAFGEKLLRNGVDAQDVAASNVACVVAGLAQKYDLFRTIVHSNHGMPQEVIGDFRTHGPDWLEAQQPGANAMFAKYGLTLPDRVEQHDLSEAKRVLGWTPKVSITTFLADLVARDTRGEDVRALWAPGSLLGPTLTPEIKK
jgi:nucleoside-diphosphate-sugar epimerase